MFLEALARLPDTSEMRKKVVESILSHSDRSSGVPSDLPSNRTQPCSRSLPSPVRDNAAILMVFLLRPGCGRFGRSGLHSLETYGDNRFEQKRPYHWASTQENVFAARGAG